MDDDSSGVGLCLCQQNAYLRYLPTTVVGCTTAAPPAEPQRQSAEATAGRSSKSSGSKAVGRTNGANETYGKAGTVRAGPAASHVSAGLPVGGGGYEVFLAESPFFPESGGQPCDLGQLVVLGEDGAAVAPPVNVLAVSWKDGSLCHLTDTPLSAGVRVEARVDWQRRYDLMQQHTGQHVLSAVADRLLGANTASWELHALDPETHGSGDYGCVAVDLTTPAITAEQLSALEAQVNEELRALRRVVPLILDPGVAADLERMQALTRDPAFRGSLPPPEKVKGTKLRLIHVEGLDINACGGTHVRSTGEVQLVKVVGAERTRGQTRVRFMCGGRAVAALAGCLGREAALTARLTCPPTRHAEMVEILLRDRREGAKARKLLAGELATHLGRMLALEPPPPPPPPPPPQPVEPASHDSAQQAPGRVGAEGSTAGVAVGAAAAATRSSPVPATGRRTWAVLHRPSSDLDFLSLVAAAALEASPALQVLLLTADGTEPGAVPPACKPGAEDSTEVTFVVAGPHLELVRTAGARVAEALGGRGGGRPGRYQGKAVGLHRLPGAKEAFLQAVASAGLV